LNTEDARQTLAQLEQKLSDASSRAIDLQTERQRISFDANTGDAAARKRLDKANAETAIIDLETENLRNAIEEARRRLAWAAKGEEQAKLSGNAEAAMKLGDSIAERARKIDAALAIVAEESTSYLADVVALNALGCLSTRSEKFRVFGEMAISAALMNCPLKLRHLAPRERHSFAELSDGWRESIVRWASPFLKQDEAA
jgi:hypothetical protein